MRATLRRLLPVSAALFLLALPVEAKGEESGNPARLATRIGGPVYDLLVEDSGHSVHTRCRRGEQARRGNAGCTVFQWDRRALEVGSITASVAFAQPVALSVPETSEGISIEVIRSGEFGAFEVGVQVTGGTATAEDFSIEPTVLSFSPSSTSELVSFFPIRDDLVEGNETVTIELFGATNGVLLGLEPVATITINDNGACRFSSEVFTTSEDAGTAEVTVNRAGGVAGALQCQARTTAREGPRAATPGEDYQPASQVLSWGDQDSDVRAFSVPILDDALDEDPQPEIVGLELLGTLPSSGHVPADAGASPRVSARGIPVLDSATLEIVDDDEPPEELGTVRLRSASFFGAEGDVGVDVVAVREASSEGAASVELCLQSGSAGPLDFFATRGTTFSWADGESGEKVLEIGILEDLEIEGSEELTASLCQPSIGLELGEPNSAIVTILDNDFEISEEIEIAGADRGPEDPIVVYDRSGRKIVVWVAPDGDGLGVFVQLYDENDVPLGDAFRANESPAGSSSQPSAAILENGSFVLVWLQVDSLDSSGSRERLARGRSGSSIVSRSFDPRGLAGDEVTVSDDEAVERPDVSADRDGEVTVTWEDDDQIKGGLLDRDLAPRAPTLDISPRGGASSPAIAVSASGDFVVVWEQESNGQEPSLFLRSYDDQGNPKGQARPVSDDPEARSPAVAMSDEGGYVVVFEAPGDGDIDVLARLFDRRGRPRGPEFRVNQKVRGNQTRARVDVNSIGDIAVTWESDPAGVAGAVGAGATSIVSRFFDPMGQAQSGDVEVAASEEGTSPRDPDVSIDEEDEVTVVFERRGPGDTPEGVFSRIVETTLASSPCERSETTLCALGGERFRVLVEWQDFEGNVDSGRAVALTGDTGYFWFFAPENIELLIKVLDGCAINDRLWVFAGGLTNVEVNIRVDDVLSGVTRSYFNSLGQSFEPIIDIGAFDTCQVTPSPLEAAPALTVAGQALSQFEVKGVSAAKTRLSDAGYQPGGPTLRLRNGRFQATLLWATQGDSGEGQPTRLTDETGTFWFFDPQNVEAVVKVLDACSLNGHYWVFAAGITDVATDLQVTDTQTSTSRQYTTKLGIPFVPVLDVEAFECP